MRTYLKTAGLAAVVLCGGGAALAADTAASIDGRWDAALTTQSGTVIPFRLDLSGTGSAVKGTLYDGFHAYDGTTSATFADGKLVLTIEHYLTTITAQLKDGQLVGAVTSQGRGQFQQFGFQAARHLDAADRAASAAAPDIAGSWVVPLPTPSAKGEKAFRFIVEQHGGEVAASILRVDGDTGSYSGTFKDGKWVLSHFDGSRPGVITVTANADGTLEVDQRANRPATAQPVSNTGGSYGAEDTPNGRNVAQLVAYRSDLALAKGLPQPENYETHTTARDPHEKFTFNFPDDTGKLVSNEDPRFKGKVVLAIVTGTWCPNCHDEAQYLVQLDKKYRNKGLAIVALDFEEPDQQGSLEREHAFVKQYGVRYTYLIAGAPEEMWEKVPQLVNLNTWPATVFIGRDGTVRGVHSGFASPASGEFNAQLKQEFTAKIESLLAEKASAVQVARAN
ncbi:MAG TPA: TlpA disulfide reductase family protein [Steroidobacteraceae bacterium]|nr:TlpA disulfide reductase family protein [Steroidobacteraceae bacterium]